MSYNKIVCNPYQWKNNTNMSPPRFQNEAKILSSSEIRIDSRIGKDISIQKAIDKNQEEDDE